MCFPAGLMLLSACGSFTLARPACLSPWIALSLLQNHGLLRHKGPRPVLCPWLPSSQSALSFITSYPYLSPSLRPDSDPCWNAVWESRRKNGLWSQHIGVRLLGWLLPKIWCELFNLSEPQCFFICIMGILQGLNKTSEAEENILPVI